MKTLAVLALVIVGCQRQDDSTTSTSTSATATAIAVASVTPLATIDPIATATASTSLTVNAPLPEGGAALLQQSEQMQLQMLQALGGTAPSRGVLSGDGGRTSELQFGARSGGPLRQGGGPGGGVLGIGARDH